MNMFQGDLGVPSADVPDVGHVPAQQSSSAVSAVGPPTGATSAPPPPRPVAPQRAKRDGRFAPKRLAILFVVVLAAVVAGTLVANALTYSSSSNDQAMSAWMSTYGSTLLAVSHDTATVNASTNDNALRGACVKLQADVNKARSNPPMPISSLQRQWSAIVSNLSVAADDCVKGIDQQSSSLLVTAQNHMNKALEADLRLVKAVQQV